MYGCVGWCCMDHNQREEETSINTKKQAQREPNTDRHDADGRTRRHKQPIPIAKIEGDIKYVTQWDLYLLFLRLNRFYFQSRAFCFSSASSLLLESCPSLRRSSSLIHLLINVAGFLLCSSSNILLQIYNLGRHHIYKFLLFLISHQRFLCQCWFIWCHLLEGSNIE